MNPKDFMDYIKSREYGAGLIFGSESLIQEEILDEIKSMLLPEFVELNYTVVDQKVTEAEGLVENLEALPFMDQTRIVIVKNNDLFKTGEKGPKKETLSALQEYLDNPSNTSLLIFAPEEVDKRSILYKYMKKNYIIFESTPLEHAELKKWIRKYMAKKDFQMGESELTRFIQRSGYIQKDSETDLNQIAQELTKLQSIYAENAVITAEDIDRQLEEEVDGDIFRLMDSVFFGKRKESILMYRGMLKGGNSSLMILTMLGKQLSLIARIHFYQGRGYQAAALGQVISIHPFALKKALQHSERVSFSDAKKLMEECLNAESKIKTGLIKEALGVELILIGILEKTGKFPKNKKTP